jgi:hypothetical protein
MFKKHLLKMAIENYRENVLSLQREKLRLEQKENEQFEEFLTRCEQIEEMGFFERFRESFSD